MKELEIQIEQLSKKGHGIGFKESGVKVEVKKTIPGDKVLVNLSKKRKGAVQGSLIQLLETSSNRIQPKCSHARECGGCSLQQLKYDKQLSYKQHLIEKLYPNEEVKPIIPCDEPLHYRNKMEFSFYENLSGVKHLGLIASDSGGFTLDLKDCVLGPACFMQILEKVRLWWSKEHLSAYFPPKDKGSLISLTLRKGVYRQNVMVILQVSGNPEYALTQQQIESFKALFDEQTSVFMHIVQRKKGAPTQVFEMHLSGPEALIETLRMRDQVIKCVISPQAFFQPNTKQAEKIYSEAIRLAELKKTDVVYDLFCGTGTIGLAMSPYVKKVIGVEINPYSVLDGKENLKLNQIENMEFIKCDMRHFEALETPDVVILDPPREGLMPSTLKLLTQIKPKKIVYIACNPFTQKSNVEELQAAGMQIDAIVPIDQFPHTAHLETIVALSTP